MGMAAYYGQSSFVKLASLVRVPRGAPVTRLRVGH